MTCPNNFDVNPLYQAANGTGERCKINRKDLQVVLECYCPDNTSFLAQTSLLDSKGSTVNRDNLFNLLVAHAKSHAKEPHEIVSFGLVDESNLLDKNCVVGSITNRTMYKGPPQSIPRDSVVAASSDGLALAIKLFLDPHPMARFTALCQENGIDPMKYAGRNFGLQRMALGNELRNRLKRNERVLVNGKVIK